MIALLTKFQTSKECDQMCRTVCNLPIYVKYVSNIEYYILNLCDSDSTLLCVRQNAIVVACNLPYFSENTNRNLD